MFDLLYVNGHIEVMDNDSSIARIFPYNNFYFVKIFSTGYDFQCESLDAALTTIKEKVGK